jgi:hypothetical protein
MSCAGCGSTSASSTHGSIPAGQVTPSRALNGCPVQQIPVDGSPKADVTVTGKNDAFDQPVTLKVNQILEARLPAGIQWHLDVTDAKQILQPVGLQGWFDQVHMACVWQFSAASTGTAKLSFSGGLVCEPNTACPAIAAAQGYDVTVK